MLSSEFSACGDTVSSHLEELVATGRVDEIPNAELQRLLGAAIRVYSAKAERDGYFPAVNRGVLTATDAMITSSSLLKLVNVAVFELGLWQSWAR